MSLSFGERYRSHCLRIAFPLQRDCRFYSFPALRYNDKLASPPILPTPTPSLLRKGHANPKTPRTTLAYASTIPGGAPFVERVFREIDMVRKQRGREIDNVVAETYAELSKVGNRGASSTEMRTIVVGQLMKLSKFAAGATQDVVIRNPNLSPYRDGAVRSLSEPKATGVPTMRVNMAVRQKQAVNG